jgi:hypothetical protein
VEKETKELLKCNHSFHKQFISTWYQKKAACPTCEDPVVESTFLPLEDALHLNRGLQVQRMPSGRQYSRIARIQWTYI